MNKDIFFHERIVKEQNDAVKRIEEKNQYT